MSEQLAFTLTAAAIGFVSAAFFCIGTIWTNAAKIEDQASGRWDFHEPVARALSAQRAQYTVGALLLVVSFSLQVVASLASPNTPANLPQWLQSWPPLLLAVLGGTSPIAAGLAWLMHKATMQRVLRISQTNLTRPAP